MCVCGVCLRVCMCARERGGRGVDHYIHSGGCIQIDRWQSHKACPAFKVTPKETVINERWKVMIHSWPKPNQNASPFSHTKLVSSDWVRSHGNLLPGSVCFNYSGRSSIFHHESTIGKGLSFWGLPNGLWDNWEQISPCLLTADIPCIAAAAGICLQSE